MIKEETMIKPNGVTLARLGQKLDDHLEFINQRFIALETNMNSSLRDTKSDVLSIEKHINTLTDQWSKQRKDIYEKIDSNKDRIWKNRIEASALGTIAGVIGGFLEGLFKFKL